jgi:acyl-coenzyme A thioesterase PaaI-like protein
MQPPAAESETSRHILAELGWNVRQVGDEMHGEAAVLPELLVPGHAQLRLSMLSAWGDQLMGLLAVRVMAPRVPSTLELEVHLYRPAPASGVIRGRARLVKAGRSVLRAVIEFSTAEDEVFAQGVGSFMLAGDPAVRLPSEISFDRAPLPAILSVPIAKRAACERAAPGIAKLPLNADACNSANSLHGGLLALAVEEALLSLAPDTSLSSLSVHYLSPVRSGPAVAKAQLHGTFGKVELFDEGQENRLAALATARIFSRAGV